MRFNQPCSGRVIFGRAARAAGVAIGLAAWGIGAGGCSSYSSERAQFESKRVTVHAEDQAPRPRSTARVASLRAGE